jgi:thiol:disulfide interchange protein DsbD
MNLSGNHVDYLVAFFGGVLLSFTPCVYPLIPISVGFIGVRAAGSKIKGLVLSLIYVTGVAIIYSLLGLIASLTGKFLGAISTHPITSIFVGVIIIVFGLSLFDKFSISLPNIIKLPTIKKGDYFSTFLLGLTSGLIISPCISPVLGAILVYLSTKKNLLYGMTLLLSFAYGMGLVLILSGTFSSILLGLPKSGKWLIFIKRFFALLLIGMGIYFIFCGLRRL